MQSFTRYRRGLLAAAVAVAFTGVGCSTTSLRSKPPTAADERLTPAEDRRALAIAHYGTALSLAAEKGIAAALPDYQKSYELDPSNVPLALWLGEYYREHNDSTNSLAILDQAANANPTTGEPWVAKGITYQSIDDIPQAIAAYKQALKIEPTHYGAVRALADIYLVQGDTNHLVGIFDQAFHQKSDDANYWMALGDLYIRTIHQQPSLGKSLDHTRARQCYERALALAPQDPDILARLGDAYMDANNFKAAANTYGKLIEVRPNIPQLREHLAAIYLKTDQKEKAVALYKELIKREPTRYEFYNVLAEIYEDLDKPDDALSYYQQSLTLNPEQPDAYLSICELQRSLKHTPEALKTLDAWKKKYPIDWRVPYLHALIETEKKDFAKAVSYYADAETLTREASPPVPTKSQAQFYFSFGAAYERLGDIDKSVPLFRKSIELDPQSPNAYNYLGYIWADKGTNLTESLELIQKAVELDPDNSAYLDSLGWVYNKLGRTADAATQLRRAIEVLEKEPKPDPEDRADDAVIYDHLAEVLLKLGKTDEAIQNWKRAAAMDPANKDIAAKLQKYSADHSAAPK